MVVKKIKLKLIKSPIGRLQKHKATLAALGLRRMQQVVEVIDNAVNRGRVNQIRYMLEVEEV